MKPIAYRLFEQEDLPLFSGGTYGPAAPLPEVVSEPEPAQAEQLQLPETEINRLADIETRCLAGMLNYNSPEVSALHHLPKEQREIISQRRREMWRGTNA